MHSLKWTALLLALTCLLMLLLSLHLLYCCNALASTLNMPLEAPDATARIDGCMRIWDSRRLLLLAIAPRSSVRRVQELLLTLRECEGRDRILADMTRAQLIDALKQLKNDTLGLPVFS